MSRAFVKRKVKKAATHWVWLAFLQCDQLEVQITNTRTDGHHLLVPVLEAALDPE